MRINLFIVACVLLMGSCGKSKEELGNEVIIKVEKYKLKKGSLPNNLDDVGIEETLEGPIFYQKESDSTFIVWYGLTLGESRTYNSKTKSWDDR